MFKKITKRRLKRSGIRKQSEDLLNNLKPAVSALGNALEAIIADGAGILLSFYVVRTDEAVPRG